MKEKLIDIIVKALREEKYCDFVYTDDYINVSFFNGMEEDIKYRINLVELKD